MEVIQETGTWNLWWYWAIKMLPVNAVLLVIKKMFGMKINKEFLYSGINIIIHKALISWILWVSLNRI